MIRNSANTIRPPHFEPGTFCQLHLETGAEIFSGLLTGSPNARQERRFVLEFELKQIKVTFKASKDIALLYLVVIIPEMPSLRERLAGDLIECLWRSRGPPGGPPHKGIRAHKLGSHKRRRQKRGRKHKVPCKLCKTETEQKRTEGFAFFCSVSVLQGLYGILCFRLRRLIRR